MTRPPHSTTHFLIQLNNWYTTLNIVYNDPWYYKVVMVCLFNGGLLPLHCRFEGGIYLMGRVIFPSRPTRDLSFWACTALFIV